MNEFERLEAFQKAMHDIQRQQQSLRKLREQITRSNQLRSIVSRVRSGQIIAAQNQLKKAVLAKDFKAVRKYTKECRKLSTEARAFSRLSITSAKVNKLMVKGMALNKKIDTLIVKMAMREAKATNGFALAKARIQNSIDKIKLTALEARSSLLKMERGHQIKKHNEVAKSAPVQSMLKNEQLKQTVRAMQEQAKANEEAIRQEQQKQKEAEAQKAKMPSFIK